MMMRLFGLLVLGMACSGDDTDTDVADADADTDADADADTDSDADTDVADAYAFASRFDGADSVSYSGQVFRQLLIDDMKTHLDGLTGRLDSGFFPKPEEVAGELEFYFDFDSVTSGAIPIGVSTDPAPSQTTYDDVSTDKNLVGKIAGNDSVTDHVDWSSQFAGWGTAGSVTPEGLVRQWIAQVDAAAEGWSDVPLDPDGVPVPAVYVTAEGLDLKQLLEKFLRGAVAFSQGADDYLDDDVDGKGLLADHDAADDTDNYTPLEHAWDEGFGYFGAARTYGRWTDDQIADPGYADVDSDGSIDLKREMSWGHSANAAKRDLGAVQATDFTQEAWDGFRGGRELIAGLTADPTPTELDALRGFRDQAVSAWEKAIASTVVHYINDVIQDMDAIGSDAYDFGDHAKHWGEMKGFALSFQFNPRSPLDTGAFQQLHDLMGDAPVLSDADQPTRDQYVADLLAARALIGTAYGFDAANLGDGGGLGGW